MYKDPDPILSAYQQFLERFVQPALSNKEAITQERVVRWLVQFSLDQPEIRVVLPVQLLKFVLNPPELDSDTEQAWFEITQTTLDTEETYIEVINRLSLVMARRHWTERFTHEALLKNMREEYGINQESVLLEWLTEFKELHPDGTGIDFWTEHVLAHIIIELSQLVRWPEQTPMSLEQIGYFQDLMNALHDLWELNRSGIDRQLKGPEVKRSKRSKRSKS